MKREASPRVRRLAVGLATAAAVTLTGTPARAVAPPHDLCGGAEVLPGAGPFPYSSSVTADVTDATVAGDPPAQSCTTVDGVSRSVWYTFTPTASAEYTISTCADAPTGTTVNDTVLGLYSSAAGCGGPLTEVGCDDDGCGYENLQSVVSANLTAGTQYFVVVWQYGVVAPLAGNTAVQLRVSQVGAPANDSCAGATALQLARSTAGTLIGSQDDYRVTELGCFFEAGVFSAGSGGEVVYSFTAPAAAKYSFKVWDFFGGPDPLLYAGSSCPAATPGTPVTVSCTRAANRATSSEEIACVPLAAGQQVFAFVDQTAASAGAPFYVQVENCAVQETVGANDTPGTAGSAACTLEAALTPGTDTDFFSLGPVPDDSRIFAVLDTSASAANDADLRVTTATDTLEYDDDNNDLPWGEFGPNVAGTMANGQQLFLRASNFDTGSPTSPYRLYTTVQPPIGLATAESEPNDSIANADSAVNQYFSGALTAGPPDQLDLYRFGAHAGDLVYIGLDGDPLRNNSPIDALITLRDAAGAILQVAGDFSFTAGTSNITPSPGTLVGITPFSAGEALVFRAPATGDYFAGVEIDPASASAGDYLLSISSNCGPERRLHTLPPCRAVDTRNADGPLGGPTLAHGAARIFNLMGACGIPPGATALTLNVTAVGPTGGGQVQLYPGDLGSPTNTTVVAFNTGNTRAAMLVMGLAADGTLAVLPTVVPSGEVDLLIDVTGYFD